MKKKIVILGCGWLGKPLALALMQAGHDVWGTSRKNNPINSVRILNFDIEHFHHIPEEIAKADILIYSIPPLTILPIKKFFSQIKRDKKIIFISSTSVYGKNTGAVDETKKLDELTGNPLLIAAESYLSSEFPYTTILRPGGLYGEQRHPLHFLTGKKELTTGGERTHLVHQKDCVQAILKIIEEDIWKEIFNLVSDLNMDKKTYYQQMAQALNLPAPEYTEYRCSTPTLISNTKSKTMLHLNYEDPLLYRIL